MRIESLEWNERNEEHIARHSVTPEEVEEVCFGDHEALRVKPDRYVVYGQTAAGRYLKLILARYNSGRFRVLTALDMTDAAKHNYKRRRRG